MSISSFPKDPFSNDPMIVHGLAQQLLQKDSTLCKSKVDSIRDTKELHLEKIVTELSTLQANGKHTERASVFSKHLLKPTSFVAEKSRSSSANWMLIVILGVLLVLGAVRQLNNKRLLSFISAFFASRFAGQLQREEYAVNNRTTAALLTSFVLVFSLFLFQLGEVAGFIPAASSPLAIYLYICLGVVSVYLVKIAVVRILAFIFKAENEAAGYIFYILLFNQLLGIVLLPVVMGLTFIRNFDPWYLVYCGLIIFSIFFIYRILRGVLLGLSKPGISRFYLFLYLCTLEFLPVIFVIKYLSMF